MMLQPTLPNAALLLAAALAGVAAALAWQRRTVWGARPLTGMMVSAAWWAVWYAAELATPRPWLAYLSARMQYLGIATLPVMWVLFALALTSWRRVVSWRTVAALMVIPAITMLLAWTNGWHELVWSGYRYDATMSPPGWVWPKGPWFWFHTGYSYLLLLVGVGTLAWDALGARGIFRQQVLLVIASAVVPWIANLLSILVTPAQGLDVTPLLFPFSGLALLWSLVRLGLFDLVPIAREAVVANLAVAVLVLDPLDRIVDLNDAAIQLLAKHGTSCELGQRRDAVFIGSLTPLREVTGGGAVTLRVGEEVFRYDVSVVPLATAQGASVGHALILRDTTGRWQATEALARARDELELRVVERTSELQDALAKREAEVESRRRLVEALEWRLELEAIVARTSQRLIRVWAEGLDDALDEALAEVGAFTQVDRAYVFRFNPDLTLMSNTHEWCAEGIEPQIENLQALPSDTVPWWMRNLREDRVVYVPSVADMPPEAAAERQLLEAQDIQSVLVVPMVMGEDLIGFLGFDAVRQPRVWPKEDILVLETLAGILVSGIERQEAEWALRASERRYRSIFETAPPLVLMTSLPGTIHDCNGRSRAMLGKEPADLVGLAVTSLLHPEDHDAWRWLRDRVRERGEASLPRCRGMRADGSTVELSVQASLLGPKGEGGALYLLSDESERRLLEAQLRQAQKMEAVGRLAGGVAHDFNNILTVMNGYTEFAIATLPEGDPLRDDLVEVKNAGERATRLTRQLLAFSRSQKLAPEPLDLSVVVRDLSKMLRRLLGEDVRLSLHLADELDPVVADRGQVEQVLINLAVNARDAMPRGGELTLRTMNASLGADAVEGGAGGLSPGGLPPGDYVELTVEDTGEGMTAYVREHLFEPFFTTKDAGQGTGLGLATVYGVVKQSGGGIEVESAAGRGTRFRIYLPTAEGSALRESAGETEVKRTGGDETILLVEDEDSVRKLSMRILREAGYQVYGASGGGAALALCDDLSLSPDLVLTDVVMPEMSGVELVARLRGLGHAPRAVYMSGYAGDRLDQEGLGQRGDRLMAKPVTRAMLLERVRSALDAEV